MPPSSSARSRMATRPSPRCSGPLADGFAIEARAMIFDFELQRRVIVPARAVPGADDIASIGRAGGVVAPRPRRMTRDVAEALLQHAVDVNADRLVDRTRRAASARRTREPELLLHGGADTTRWCSPAPAPRGSTGAASATARGRCREPPGRSSPISRSSPTQRRSVRRVLLGAAQHRSHRGQDLSEFVVQLARDFTQRRLARGDQRLRQLAALLGERGQLARTGGGSNKSGTGPWPQSSSARR